MTTLRFTQQAVSSLTVDDVAHLAGRLEQDDYGNPFEALQDWHLLRAVAHQRHNLVEPYAYLLDLESDDEA